MRRLLMIWFGWFLIVFGWIVSWGPGPMGAPIMAAGGVILVQRSPASRRLFARLRVRFPWASKFLDDIKTKLPRFMRYFIVRTDPRRVLFAVTGRRRVRPVAANHVPCDVQ